MTALARHWRATAIVVERAARRSRRRRVPARPPASASCAPKSTSMRTYAGSFSRSVSRSRNFVSTSPALKSRVPHHAREKRDRRRHALDDESSRARAACARALPRGRVPGRSAWRAASRSTAAPCSRRRRACRGARRAARRMERRRSCPGDGWKLRAGSSAFTRHSMTWPRSGGSSSRTTAARRPRRGSAPSRDRRR